jgi:hypothetical protein
MTSSHPESDVIRIPVLPTMHGGESSMLARSELERSRIQSREGKKHIITGPNVIITQDRAGQAPSYPTPAYRPGNTAKVGN